MDGNILDILTIILSGRCNEKTSWWKAYIGTYFGSSFVFLELVNVALKFALMQYTTQLSVDDTPQLYVPHRGDKNNLVPVQIVFVLKAKTEKKSNSHWWLFSAIGKTLQVCLSFL
jgi:hypothetical protein